MQIRDPKPHGPLSESRLVEFERTCGLALPPDYREFLLEFNGGVPFPSSFWITEPTNASGVQQFYGLHDGPSWLSIHTYARNEASGVPAGILPIGDDGVGDWICIGIAGAHYGRVYFVDHEVHPLDDPDSMKGITELAESFERFLANLMHHPEDE
jgi:hypothetical protein